MFQRHKAKGILSYSIHSAVYSNVYCRYLLIYLIPILFKYFNIIVNFNSTGPRIFVPLSPSDHAPSMPSKKWWRTINKVPQDLIKKLISLCKFFIF
jgi:hypothetical protein